MTQTFLLLRCTFSCLQCLSQFTLALPHLYYKIVFFTDSSLEHQCPPSLSGSTRREKSWVLTLKPRTTVSVATLRNNVNSPHTGKSFTDVTADFPDAQVPKTVLTVIFGVEYTVCLFLYKLFSILLLFQCF